MFGLSPPSSRARLEGTPASPKTPTPRELLRDAQRAAAEAVEAAQVAAGLASRAQNAVDAARAAVAAHDALDGRVAAYNADLLRAGEAAGRPLPPDLITARHDQAAARLAFADAVGAHALLATEARQAAAAAEQAGAAVRQAADAVAGEIALGLLAELRDVERQAGELRVVLSGYIGGRTISEAPPPWAIAQLRHEAQHAALCDAVNPDWSAASARWQDFRRALMADADAALAAAP